MNIDLLIKKSILALREDKKKKTVKAKVGRGNLKTYIRQGKARSENDPQGLLKDLGVPLKFSKEVKVENLASREKVIALLRRSFQKEPAMMSAFTGVRYAEGATEAFVKINDDLISSRDATMFVNNILRAAQNAEALSIDEDIEIKPTGKQEVYILFIQ